MFFAWSPCGEYSFGNDTTLLHYPYCGSHFVLRKARLDSEHFDPALDFIDRPYFKIHQVLNLEFSLHVFPAEEKSQNRIV